MNIKEDKEWLYVNKTTWGRVSSRQPVEEYFYGVEKYDEEFDATHGYKIETSDELNIYFVYLISKRAKENDISMVVDRLSGEIVTYISLKGLQNLTETYFKSDYRTKWEGYCPDYATIGSNKKNTVNKINLVKGNDWKEWLRTAEDVYFLTSMFTKIYQHASKNYEEMEYGSLAIITNVYFDKIKFDKPITLDLKLDYLYCSDWGYLEESNATGGKVTVLTPVINRECYVGYYIKEKHIFLAPDFSHDKNYLHYAPVIEWLRENLYTKTIVKKDKKEVIKVTVGTDPEFEIISPNGGITDASKIVMMVNKALGEDSYRAKYGIDGACHQVELRPTHSTNEDDVINDIKDILDKYQEFELSVKGDDFPLGAHIHIGVEVDGVKCVAPRNDTLVKLYDIMFGSVFKKTNGKERKEYAKLGQHRDQPHGFEYRSLPSSVFENPEIARIVLKGFKNATQNVYEKKVTYNIPPTYEDYRDICGYTQVEYNTLIDFPKTFKGNNIIDNWVDRKHRFALEIDNRIQSNEYVDELVKSLGTIKLSEPYKIYIIPGKISIGTLAEDSAYVYDSDKYIIGVDNNFIKFGYGFSNIFMNIVWLVYSMHKQFKKLGGEEFCEIAARHGFSRLTKVIVPATYNL